MKYTVAADPVWWKLYKWISDRSWRQVEDSIEQPWPYRVSQFENIDASVTVRKLWKLCCWKMHDTPNVLRGYGMIFIVI